MDPEIKKLGLDQVEEQIALGQAAIDTNPGTAYGHLSLAHMMLPTDSRALLMMAALAADKRTSKMIEAAISIGLPEKMPAGILRKCFPILLAEGIRGWRLALRLYAKLSPDDQDRNVDSASLAEDKISKMERRKIVFGEFPDDYCRLLKNELLKLGHIMGSPWPQVNVFSQIEDLKKLRHPRPLQILWATYETDFSTISNVNLGALYYADLIVAPNAYAVEHISSRVPPGIKIVQIDSPSRDHSMHVTEKRGISSSIACDHTYVDQVLDKIDIPNEHSYGGDHGAFKIFLEPSGEPRFDLPELREAEMGGAVPVVSAVGCMPSLLTRGYAYRQNVTEEKWQLLMAERVKMLLSLPKEDFDKLSAEVKRSAKARYAPDVVASQWCETIGSIGCI